KTRLYVVRASGLDFGIVRRVTMPRPISDTISVSLLSHNLQAVTRQLGVGAGQAGPRIWAVIKANAYGHGIDNAVQGFAQAQGLAMLDLNEAVRCRELGWTKPILLLEGFFQPRDLAVLQEYGLSTAVHTQEQLDMLAAHKASQTLNAYIKLNTGMNRLGFAAKDYAAAYAQAQTLQARGIL